MPIPCPLILFHAEGLDNPDAGNRFLQNRIQLGAPLLYPGAPAANLGTELHDRQDRHRQDEQRQQRELPLDQEQQRNEPNDVEGLSERVAEQLGRRVAKTFDIRVETRHDLARWTADEKVEGQGVQVRVQIVPDVSLNPLRHVPQLQLLNVDQRAFRHKDDKKGASNKGERADPMRL